MTSYEKTLNLVNCRKTSKKNARYYSQDYSLLKLFCSPLITTSLVFAKRLAKHKQILKKTEPNEGKMKIFKIIKEKEKVLENIDNIASQIKSLAQSTPINNTTNTTKDLENNITEDLKALIQEKIIFSNVFQHEYLL